MGREGEASQLGKLVKSTVRAEEMPQASGVLRIVQQAMTCFLTIMHADRIVVLNEGDVVGIGTHRELLETCPIYYDIAASQLSEEELA